LLLPKRSAEYEREQKFPDALNLLLIDKLKYGREERKAGKPSRIAKRRAERERLQTPLGQIETVREIRTEPVKKRVAEQKEVLAGTDPDLYDFLAPFRKFEENVAGIMQEKPKPIARVNPVRERWLARKQQGGGETATPHNYEPPTNLPEALQPLVASERKEEE
jgi:hypothetical protein